MYIYYIMNTLYFQDLKRNAKRRIISKSGDCNTQLYRVSSKKRRFMKVRISFNHFPHGVKIIHKEKCQPEWQINQMAKYILKLGGEIQGF